LIGGASLQAESFLAVIEGGRSAGASRVSQARRGPLVLAILDGWGERAETYGNAIAAADAPNWRRILATYPHSLLSASGEDVGLPKGVMGNSEVGHINIGSGRVVPQGVVVINESLADGSFARNPVLAECIAHVTRTHGRLHLMGLLSDGRVHSSLDHLLALVDAVAAAGVEFAVHPVRRRTRRAAVVDGALPRRARNAFSRDRCVGRDRDLDGPLLRDGSRQTLGTHGEGLSRAGRSASRTPLCDRERGAGRRLRAR
jgi:hypothetical protein